MICSVPGQPHMNYMSSSWGVTLWFMEIAIWCIAFNIDRVINAFCLTGS